jgi:hypothetical protein
MHGDLNHAWASDHHSVTAGANGITYQTLFTTVYMTADCAKH